MLCLRVGFSVSSILNDRGTVSFVLFFLERFYSPCPVGWFSSHQTKTVTTDACLYHTSLLT